MICGWLPEQLDQDGEEDKKEHLEAEKEFARKRRRCTKKQNAFRQPHCGEGGKTSERQ